MWLIHYRFPQYSIDDVLDMSDNQYNFLLSGMSWYFGGGETGEKASGGDALMEAMFDEDGVLR